MKIAANLTAGPGLTLIEGWNDNSVSGPLYVNNGAVGVIGNNQYGTNSSIGFISSCLGSTEIRLDESVNKTISWAKKKMEEEAELKRLIDDNPALREAFNMFLVTWALVK